MTVVKNWRLEHIQLFFSKLFPLPYTKIRKRTAPCPLTGNFFIHLQQVLLGLVLCVVATLVKQIYEEHGSGGKHSLVHWWSCVLRQTGLLWKGDWRQQPWDGHCFGLTAALRPTSLCRALLTLRIVGELLVLFPNLSVPTQRQELSFCCRHQLPCGKCSPHIIDNHALGRGGALQNIKCTIKFNEEHIMKPRLTAQRSFLVPELRLFLL